MLPGAYGKEEWDQFVALVGDPSASMAAWGPKAIDDELESRGWKGSKAGRVQAYYKTLQQGIDITFRSFILPP